MSSLAEFVPAPGVLAAYTLACFVLFITPGPDMSLFLAKTIAGGRRAGLFSMLGAMAGCCLHTLLAAIGVSALLAASATAFAVLKVVGAGYLLWLAIDALRNGSALRMRDGGRQEIDAWHTFLLGFGVNVTNPKIVLFFVTFLPQFVDPESGNAPSQLLFLGLYFIAFTTPFGALLVLLAERMIGLTTRHPRAMRMIDYAFASVFGTFALRIATMPGR